VHDFTRLTVWQRSRLFARDVVRLTSRVRRGEDKVTIAQLRRSALGIPAAICEGCGKRTRAESIRYLDIAQGSAMESEGHLLQAIDIAVLPERECRKLLDEVTQIQRMLRALMRNFPADDSGQPHLY
jgi:four helix bundle protein